MGGQFFKWLEKRGSTVLEKFVAEKERVSYGRGVIFAYYFSSVVIINDFNLNNRGVVFYRGRLDFIGKER